MSHLKTLLLSAALLLSLLAIATSLLAQHVTTPPFNDYQANYAGSVLSGGKGSPDSAQGIDGQASSAYFFSPQGLAYDPLNSIIYVADTHRIRTVDPATGAVQTIVYDTDLLQAPASIALPFSLDTTMQFKSDWPYYALFVSDICKRTIVQVTATQNGSLFENYTPQLYAGVPAPLDQSTNCSQRLAPGMWDSPAEGTLDGWRLDVSFEYPMSIAFDKSSSFLYVSDPGNQAIRRINTTSGMVSTFWSNTAGGILILDASIPGGTFLVPGVIAINPKNTLFMANYTGGNLYTASLSTTTSYRMSHYAFLPSNGPLTSIYGDRFNNVYYGDADPSERTIRMMTSDKDAAYTLVNSTSNAISLRQPMGIVVLLNSTLLAVDVAVGSDGYPLKGEDQARILRFGCNSLNVYSTDLDQDSYPRRPNASAPMVSTCFPGQELYGWVLYTEDRLDCNDLRSSVHPGASEVCDGIDNNCNGEMDEGFLISYFPDTDGDGFGDTAAEIRACSEPSSGKYTQLGGDCDDKNEAVHPEAQEVCNHIDDNCDDQVDEGVSHYYTVYRDLDGDGYGNNTDILYLCLNENVPGGYVSYNGIAFDCDDSNSGLKLDCSRGAGGGETSSGSGNGGNPLRSSSDDGFDHHHHQSSSSSSSHRGGAVGDENNNNSSSTTTLVLAATVATVGGVLLCVIVVLVVVIVIRAMRRYLRKHNKKFRFKSEIESESESEQEQGSSEPTWPVVVVDADTELQEVSTSPPPPPPPPPEGHPGAADQQFVKEPHAFEARREDVKVMQKIGKGAFGVVYKAQYKGMQVAIKVFDVSDAVPEEQKKIVADFENEVKVLYKLEHPNILALYGAVLRLPKLAIITEYMEYGTIYDWVHKKLTDAPTKRLTWRQKLILLMDTAKGLQYIHTNNIIHRDIKSQNILVTSGASARNNDDDNDDHPNRYTAKIADFGLGKFTKRSRKTLKTHHHSKMVGTALWMAPEVTTGNDYDAACDVFSLGIVMYELLTEKMPYFHVPINQKHNIHLKVAMDPAFRPLVDDPEVQVHHEDQDEASKRKYIDIMKRCWHGQPSQRPNLVTIYNELKAIYHQTFQK